MFLRGNSWIAPAMFTTHFFTLVTALAISATIVPVIMHLDFKHETLSYPDFSHRRKTNLATVYSSCVNANQVALTFVCLVPKSLAGS